eukprot:scaffold189973_cov41-Prasinocladus_malaysianus.AAC.1
MLILYDTRRKTANASCSSELAICRSRQHYIHIAKCPAGLQPQSESAQVVKMLIEKREVHCSVVHHRRTPAARMQK